MANEILEMALQYADIGIPVMPLHGINNDGTSTCKQGYNCSSAGKHPIFSRWQVKATTDKTIITNWWNQYPNANIGIPTGEKSVWLVLDIDTKYDGNQTLTALEKLHGQLPDTVTAITGSGGEHRIFQYPNGLKIPNKVSFDNGLDIRSNGGLIVAAPSLHASGNRYSWLDGHSPFDIEPANAPKWLLDLMMKQKSNIENDSNLFVYEGNRNNHLTSLAGTLRRKGMSEAGIVSALLAQNYAQCKPPLEEKEIRTIAKSISRYEPNKASLLSLKLNDIGNAGRLVEVYGNDIRFCPEWNCWFIYDGYWKKDIEGNIYLKCRETIRLFDMEAQNSGETKLMAFATKSGFHTRIEAMINQAKTLVEYGIPVVSNRWDANPGLICLKNVTIDFNLDDKTSPYTVREHKREDYITKQLDFDYDSSIKCSRWMQFLEDIIPDVETREFVKRAIGYTLTGSTREDMLFILHGSGSNGKSTFIETIATLLGTYAKTIQPETIMQKEKSGALNTEIASICGARLVKTSEIDEGKRLSESLVKQLTGGDKISTRFLFGRDFEYEPTYKVWISTNHKPKIYGDDNGIWRRICLIPFEVTIPDDKKDTDLDKKLANEIPGIFNWALEGLMEWKQVGLKPPRKVSHATMEYRMQEDLLQGFIDNCIEVSSGNRISATDLYKYYEWYCEQNGITRLSSTKFGTKYREDKGFEKKQICGRVYYIDIKIKEEIDESIKKDVLFPSESAVIPLG